MPKVLFLTPYPIESASERYRIYQFLPYLERTGLACVVRPFATSALFRAIQEERSGTRAFDAFLCCVWRGIDILQTGHFDAVVIHREAFPFFCPLVEKGVLKRNAKVIYSFDDAVHVGHREFGSHKYPWFYKFKYGAGVNELLTKSTYVVAGSRVLAEHARQFNPRVALVPTVTDIERYSVRPRQGNGPLVIGWMGSRSTSPYLLQIEPALQRLSRAYGGRIRFRLFGHPRRRLDVPNFESLPFDLGSEIDDLRSIDIGLMPIIDNEWTRGKCAFKAIQYMAVGIPVVASPVGMAKEVIQNDVNGFLARTPDEWFDALDTLAGDEDLRGRMGADARRTVEERYSLQRWGPIFADFLLDVVEGRTPRVTSPFDAAGMERPFARGRAEFDSEMGCSDAHVFRRDKHLSH